MTQYFFSQSLEGLEHFAHEMGFSPFHAKDLYRGAFKERLTKPWERAGIPKRFSKICDEAFSLSIPKILGTEESSYDGSVKFLIQLSDGLQVETVLMPESKRLTVCVSSQVGCAQGCVFCHTGRMGLIRNLEAYEIVGQLITANDWLSAHPDWLKKQRLSIKQRVTNVVFMGMGEPLDNVPAVAKAIEILTNPFGFNMALRKISVSTAGHLDGLKKITETLPDVRLALSLHTPFENERSKIMPINRKWPIQEVIGFLRLCKTQLEHGLLIQYTLIRGVNDSKNHAEELIALLSGLNVKINLIPLNPVSPSRLQGPDIAGLESFRDCLYEAGLRVMVRYSKGQDIAAACGQLVRPL